MLAVSAGAMHRHSVEGGDAPTTSSGSLVVAESNPDRTAPSGRNTEVVRTDPAWTERQGGTDRVIAVDPGTEIIIPASVAVIGAVIAGLSAAVKAWVENRDARRKTERQLELAKSRTQFVEDWIRVSKELGEDSDAVKRAIEELDEAYSEAQVAFSRTRTRSVFGQFRALLMLVRRKNRASYVVSGVFLFVATFVWLLLCIPTPGDDSFSYVAAIFSAFFTTIVLRVAAEMIVRVFERFTKSGAQAITAASLTDNVATITTSAGHGLERVQLVVVDATNDVFDGTFVVASVSSDTTFTYAVAAANVASGVVTGSVYRDTFNDQMRALLMLQSDRSRGAYFASGLFLISLLVVAQWSLTSAMSELRTDVNPRCYIDEYYGSFYGDVDPYDVPPYDGAFLDGNGADLDTDNADDWFPLFGTWTPADDGTWIVVDGGGNEFVFDGTGLWYADGSSDLYKKGRDGSFTGIGDPCDPQTVRVRMTNVGPEVTDEEIDQLGAAPLFAYYQPPEYLDLVFVDRVIGTDSRSGEGRGAESDVQDVKGYYGFDGRFIPVCDDSYAAVNPCIEEASVTYDSGLYATVLRLGTVGLWIIGFAIASRVIFGLIAWGFDRYANRRSATGDDDAAAGSELGPPELHPS